jgi:Polyketide synthase dehydratase
VPTASPVVLSVTLPDLPGLADHPIAGKPTVPAVELLELLARSVAEHRAAPPSLPLAMSDVRFARFLPAEEIPRCNFEVTLEEANGGVRASLTSSIALAGGIRRSREHAVATFLTRATAPALPPAPTTDFEVAAERVYRDLIQFGPRYCNLAGALRLGRAGGMGRVRSPKPPRQPPPLLGCPFLLDAAMHLACVWGQRYTGTIAYPTGFALRVLAKPLSAGERRCFVFPRSLEPRRLLCDLWLCDEQGEVGDAVTGLAMAPLAAGLSPPPWITVTPEHP